MAARNRIALELGRKIGTRKAQVAVIGLGYVGLPLACELVRIGFKVVGIDTDQERISSIAKGHSFVSDIPSAQLQSILHTKCLMTSFSFGPLAASDVIIICVPTPLNKTQDPDLSSIINATSELKKL